MLFLTFALYFAACSAVFSYGIGMNLLLCCESHFGLRIYKMAAKVAISTILSTALLWYLFAMLPLRVSYPLLPLLASVIPFALNVILSAFISFEDEESRLKAPETFLSFSVVFLSIKEGLSFLDAVIISFSCIASFALLLFLMTSAIRRLSPIEIPETRLNLPLFMVLLGILSFFQPLFEIILTHSFSSGFLQ